jgi:hypothetical protein
MSTSLIHPPNFIILLRFQVLMVESMKMTAFWNMALSSLVEVDQLFRGAYCLHHQRDHPDDGGSIHL